MIVMSLFDGMGCGNVALDRGGIKPTQYFASEIDKYAISVAKKNHPETIHLGCVKTVRKMVEAGLFRIDLLIAGSPCQGFSFAGKQLAFDDPRSALFFEFVAILIKLKEINPNIKFMLENTKMKKQHLDVITDVLGVKPILINSALVSAQNRERYYWCNWAVDQPSDRGIFLKDIIEDDEADRDKNRCVISSIGRTTPREYFKMKQGQLIKIGNVDDKAGFEMTKRIYSIDGKSPTLMAQPRGGVQPPNIGFKKLIKLGNSHPSGRGMNGEIYDIQGKVPTITTNKGEGSKIGFKKENSILVYEVPHGYNKGGLQEKDKFSTLRFATSCNYKISTDCVYYRKLTPVECERLQTLSDDYTAGVSNTQRYKMLGNGWNADTVAHIFRSMPI